MRLLARGVGPARCACTSLFAPHPSNSTNARVRLADTFHVAILDVDVEHTAPVSLVTDGEQPMSLVTDAGDARVLTLTINWQVGWPIRSQGQM